MQYNNEDSSFRRRQLVPKSLLLGRKTDQATWVFGVGDITCLAIFNTLKPVTVSPIDIHVRHHTAILQYC